MERKKLLMDIIFNIVFFLVMLYILLSFISSFPWSKYFFRQQFHVPKDKYLITIDDAPTIYTKDMINLLKKFEHKALFFVNGEKIEKREEQFKIIIDSKNDIGNHSYKHYFFNPMLKTAIIYDLKRNEELINKYGYKTEKIRTHHGYQTFGLMKFIKNNSYSFYHWDIILLDFIPFIPYIFLKIQADRFLKKGGILCMHSNKISIKIMKYILKKMEVKKNEI